MPHSTAASEVQTMAGIAKIASGYVDRKLVWKDYHRGSGGKLRRLFKGSMPEPDENHTFIAKQSGHHFSVAVYRYGNFWYAVVFGLDGGMTSFEGKTKDQCLCQIEGGFAFGDALEPIDHYR